MRPPILRWKVMLLLLAVVVAAVSLASALGPGNRQVSGWKGSWTGYSRLGSVQPAEGRPFSVKISDSASRQKVRDMVRTLCASIRAELPKAAPSAKPGLRAEARELCHTRG